jgi:hypothetical protein
METIPPELHRKIALSLTYDELLRFCSTSVRFKNICKDDKFWLDKIRFDFPNHGKFNFFKVPSDKMEIVYLWLLTELMKNDIEELKGELNYSSTREISDLEIEKSAISYQIEKLRNSGHTHSAEFRFLRKELDRVKQRLYDIDKRNKSELDKIHRKMIRYQRKIRENWPDIRLELF